MQHRAEMGLRLFFKMFCTTSIFPVIWLVFSLLLFPAITLVSLLENPIKLLEIVEI